MKWIRLESTIEDPTLVEFCQRSPYPDHIEQEVQEILNTVKKEGDPAIVRYLDKFDKVQLQPKLFRVHQEEYPSIKDLPSSWVQAIEYAHHNITLFAQQCLPSTWEFSPREGVKLGEKYIPFNRILAYVPGGSAPLVSTVLHTVTFAKVAGVKEIVVTTPPGKKGKVHPAILFAAQLAGATDVYRLGGVYAIGAFTYGTQTILPVEKIVGPGNAYLTAAKKLVYGRVAIDMIAGPSELLIIADHTANPQFIAADFLTQIEHGSGREQAVLVSTDHDLLTQTKLAIDQLIDTLPRKDMIQQCLNQSCMLVEVDSLDTAIAVANRYAPEHLEVQVADPSQVVPRLTCAGAIFIGPWTPESLGDFIAGPSHVLPTGGAARFFSGLTVNHFYRKISLLEYDRNAMIKEEPFVTAFAEMEDLQAHAQAVWIRKKFGDF